MEAVNGVSDVDKGGPPPPSPLTGCYLLIVIGEPHCNEHKDIILQKVAKGLLSWDVNDCLVDLEKELAIITEQALEGEEARYGERLIQFASENLVTEILIHPVVSTLAQCVRNLLSSFTRHRHIIHAGYTFANNGSWILQDGTFSLADFSEAFQEIEVLRVIRAYENGISLHIHCAPEGDWTRLPKEPFTKSCKVRVNPNDVLTAGSPKISSFINYLQPFLIPAELESILESSDVVGNIRFSRPTLYVFPGGQGDAALFGINGFNMLLDGGFSRKACFWDFVRHLDRLDAVLLTRLNNSNVNGISAVLRRKKQNAVYPQIGHFFCNIQERKAILSPDGDKDKDPLLINLLEEGQEIVSNLRHLSLTPQVCYRDSEPINLYHKVGHGTLDMYVLSPAKDSKEVREFLQKWNNNDQKLFANQKSIRDFVFPLQNLVSICALLVWQPANPEDTITRILFPGSSPQSKIFEGLDKIKNLEFIKHPVCSEKSLVPASVIKTKQSVLDKILAPEKKPPTDNKKEKPKPETIENDSMGNGEVHAEKEKVVKKSDSTESEKSISKPRKTIENGGDKVDKPKPKPKEIKPKARSDSQQRKLKTAEKKPSPTTPKKTVDKVNGEPKPKLKASPSATPAKSTKEANNRKVVESKKTVPKKETTPRPAPDKKESKPERKPISRRPKDVPKLSSSPSKKVNGVQKPDSISKRSKLDKEGTTDSSTVSTPSADQDSILKKDISKLTPEEIQNLKAQELADLKEEQEAVKEIEAVFRKSELQQEKPSDFRKIKDLSIDDKLESEEYLIIEKTEIEPDASNETKEDETQKMARDSEESEKQRKLSGEIQSKETEVEQNRVEIEDEVQKIITSASDIVKAKDEVIEASKEVSATSPEDKIDISIDKKDNENEIKETAPESLPDEKGSANIESGATTTAPTLPEDERMPLDEIKEDNGDQVIEEKHVKENTKEKDIPVIQLPPKTFENISKLPPVVGIRLDKQSHIRDIVKTPDEVADLPVHEEVDIDHYDDYHKTEEEVVKKDQQTDEYKEEKDAEIKKVDEVAATEEKTEIELMKTVDIEKSKPDDQKLDKNDDEVEKEDTAVILQDLNKKELSKSPDEEKDTDEHELELKKEEEVKLSSHPPDDTKQAPVPSPDKLEKEESKLSSPLPPDSAPVVLKEEPETASAVVDEAAKTQIEEVVEESKTEKVENATEIDKLENESVVETLESQITKEVTAKSMETHVDNSNKLQEEKKTEILEKEINETKVAESLVEVKSESPIQLDKAEETIDNKEVEKSETLQNISAVEKSHEHEEIKTGSSVTDADEKSKIPSPEPPTIDKASTDESELDKDQEQKETVPLEKIHEKEDSQLVEEQTKVEAIDQENVVKGEIAVSPDEKIDEVKKTDSPVSIEANKDKPIEQDETESKVAVETATFTDNKTETQEQQELAKVEQSEETIITTKIVQEEVEVNEEKKSITEIVEKSEIEIKEKDDEKLQDKKEIVVDTKLLAELLPEVPKDDIVTAPSTQTPKDDSAEQINLVKEDVAIIEKIDEKLQKLKEATESEKTLNEIVTVDRKVEKVLHAEPVIITTDSNPESPMVERPDFDDKIELGRKSPKEREEDVAKIVASVAEVLKSDAPLEEFEGKIPFNIPYKSYTTELRETHITTVDSPVTDEQRSIAESVCPKTTSLSFIEEERKISSIHEEVEPQESKITKMMKESEELMKATSKIISDIKLTQPKDEEDEEKEEDAGKDEDAGIVHRMLVTASSEDGGEETEICPPGTITFSRSSESSGRSSPDPQSSQKASQISSLADTYSEGTTVIGKTVKETVTKEIQNGLDEKVEEVKELTNGFCEKVEELKSDANEELCEIKDTVKKVIVDEHDTVLESTKTAVTSQVVEDFKNGTHIDKQETVIESIEQPKPIDIPSKVEQVEEAVKKEIVETIHSAISDKVDKETPIEKDSKLEIEDDKKAVKESSTEEKEKDTSKVVEDLKTDFGKISDPIKDSVEKSEDVTKQITTDLKDSVEEAASQVSSTQQEIKKSITTKVTEEKYDIYNGLENVEKMLVDVIMGDREDLPSPKEISRKSSTVSVDTGESTALSKQIEKEISENKEVLKDVVADTEEAVKESERIVKESRDNIENDHDVREDVLERSAQDLEKNYEIMSDMTKSIVFEKCDNAQEKEKKYQDKCEKVLELSANALEETYESTLDMAKSIVFDKCTTHEDNEESIKIKSEHVGEQSMVSAKASDDIKEEDNLKLEDPSLGVFSSGKTTPDLANIKLEDLSGKSTPDLKLIESLKNEDSCILSGKSTPDLKDSITSGKATPDLTHLKEEEFSGKSTPDLKADKQKDSIKTDDISVMSGKSTPDLKDSLASGKATPDLSHIKEELSGKSTPDLKPLDSTKTEDFSVLSGKSTPDLKDSLTSGKDTPDITSIKEEVVTGKSTPDLKDNKPTETIKSEEICVLSGKSTPDLKDSLTSGKATPDLTSIKDDNITEKATSGPKEDKQSESIKVDKDCELSGKSTPEIKEPLTSGKATPDRTHIKEEAGTGKSTPDLKDNKQIESIRSEDICVLSGKSSPDLKDPLSSGKATPDLTETKPKDTVKTEESVLSGISTPDIKDSISGKTTPDPGHVTSKDVLNDESIPDHKQLESTITDISLTGKSTPDSVTTGKVTPDLHEKIEDASGKVTPTSVKNDEQSLQISGKSTPDLKESLPSGKATPDIPEKVEEIVASGKATPTSVKIDEIGSQISGKSTPDLKDSLTSGKATPDMPEKVEETVASGKATPTSVKIDEPCLQVSGKSTPDLKDSLTSGKATPDIPEKVEEIIASGKATPTSVKIDELCSQVSGKSTPDLKDSLTSGKATPDIPEKIEDTVASGKATPTSVKIEETPLHTSEKSTPDVKDSLTSDKTSPTIPEKIEDTVSSGKATPTSAKIDDQSLQTSGKSTPDLKDSLTSGKTTSDIPEKIEDAVMSETPTSMKIEQASGKTTPDLKDSIASGKVTPDVTSIKPEEELSTLSGKTTPDPKDVRKDSVHSEKSALEINDVTSVKEEVVLSEKSSTEVTIGVKGSVGEEVSLIKSGKTTPDPTSERKESVASEKSIADIKDDRKNSITSGKSTPDLKDKDRIESGKTSPDVSKTPEKSDLSGKASPVPSERKGSVLSDKVESELKEERKSSAVSEKSSPDLKVDHHQDLVDSGKSSPQPPVSGKSTPDVKDSKDSVVSGKTSPTKIEITSQDLTNDRKDAVISVEDKEDSKETAFEKDGKDSIVPEKILDSKEEQKDIKPLETVSKLTEERKDSIVSGKTTPEIKESDNLKVEEQSSLVSSPGISGKSTPELKEENKDSLLSGKSSPYPIDVKELDTSIKSDSVLSSAEKEHSDRLTPDTRQGQTPSPELLSETASDKDKPTVPSSEVKDSGKSTPQLQKDEKSSSMDNLETNLEKGIQKIVPKSTSPEKGHVEKLIEKETFDMTKSIIPEVEMSQLLPDQPDASIKKLSVSDVEICIKEVTKEEPPESSVMTDSVIQHDVSKTTESTIKKDEIKAGPSSITAKSSTDEVHLSGKSTPDVAEVEKLKEIQETLKHEKHIPGSSTPPTVPVSPIVKELSSTPQPEEAKTPIKTVSSLKESEVRSYTPASDDYDIGVSTYSDISSGQVSRAPHPLETERIESDDDDDVPGSPMSITSQVAHSRSSSRYDFEDERIGSKMDPMNTSFYGALPDEPTDLDYDKALLEHRQSRGEDLVTTTEASSSYLYEVTKAKFTSSTSDLSKNDDLQLDQINKNEHQPDLMTASFMGDLPSESSSKKDPFDSWGKPLGLPSPAPPSDNRGTPKKERKLPSNVSAKNKLNDDKKRADSPSKYKNKKFSPIYVDLTYVPHHGNGFYSYVEFFKRVRARYYVFSGIEPSREVYNALLEAKQTWEDKELEVTIIPTYDTDILGYWVAENEELLTKCKIDLSPSASRCTINLQDHETSCSAYRLEF